MKKYLLILVLIVTANKFTFSQTTFYNTNIIQKVEIFFSFSNWDYRLDTASAGADGFILADSCLINGVHFDSVGVKYKGNSSNSPANKKNPFHLSLDEFNTNQAYQGYADVKLNNGYADPSCVREITAYQLLSRYMDGPNCNYATVYVNNVWRGIYSNVESINKKFIGEHYYTKNGAFFKCNPKTIGTNLPTLVPTGWDSINTYPLRYEKKSTTGWTTFIQFQNNLANNLTAIKTELDIDRTLWMHAFNNVLVNLDSYTGAFAQNYYMYKDANGIWIPTVWDLNMCFGGFTGLGGGANLNNSGLQQLSPMVKSTDSTRPLISKLLNIPTYKKMYIAHCKTILAETMDATSGYYSIANNAKNTIADSIAVDSLLFFTYAKFLANIDTAVVTTGTATRIGIKQLLQTRQLFLNNTPEYLAVPPTITSISTIPATVAINTNVTINATITNVDSVYLGFREVTSKPFTRIIMWDDGTHNDGIANDGIYGASFTATSGKMEYYIYASNANAGMFSPVRAEHEFYTLLPTIPPVDNKTLVINEILPYNISAVTDSSGEFDDYIELKNKSNTAINLSGLYLSDDASNLAKWAFPNTATIPANGFAIVWADQDGFQKGLHSNFKLNNTGEQLYLSYANGSIVDSITFNTAIANKAYGRCADGIGSIVLNLAPTPLVVNACYVGITTVVEKNINLYPNPAQDAIWIDSDSPLPAFIIYNTAGKIVWQQAASNSFSTKINTSQLPVGVYFVQMQNQKNIKFVVQANK